MNKFSFNRFVTYSKSELMSNRRYLLILLASAFAFFMIAFYFNHLGQPTDKWDTINGMRVITGEAYGINIPCIVSWGGIFIFCGIFSSLSFKKYFNKGYSSSALMLPVAQSEKFAFALIFNTIIVPLSLISMASIISYCWTLVYGIEWDFISPSALELIEIALASSVYLSTFFFGAIFFRRNQFFYTLLSLFVINVTIGYLFFIIAQFVDLSWFECSILDNIRGLSVDAVQTIIDITSNIFFLALTSTLLWFSWTRFRKLQITK